MPWVRKTPQEIEIERRQIKDPLVGAAWLAAFTAVAIALGYRGRGLFVVVTSPMDEVVDKLPVVAIVFLIAFVYFLRQKRRTGEISFFYSNALLCTACFEAQAAECERCACGGSVEPLSYWKWQDEPSQEGSNLACKP